jgi:hypothetical protein
MRAAGGWRQSKRTAEVYPDLAGSDLRPSGDDRPVARNHSHHGRDVDDDSQWQARPRDSG